MKLIKPIDLIFIIPVSFMCIKIFGGWWGFPIGVIITLFIVVHHRATGKV